MLKLRRSMLYVPGYKEKFLEKATKTDADCVILDLQESVPESDKDRARGLVKELLMGSDFGSIERIVRVNLLDSQYIEQDIKAMAEAEPDALIIPKVHSKKEISKAEELLSRYENELGKPKKVMLMPLIESAKGVFFINEILSSTNRITALCFGKEDLYSDTGATITEDGNEMLYIKSKLVLAAAAFGIDAIDSPSLYTNNPDLVEKEARRSYVLGFAGAQVIHPSQIPPVNKAFLPSEKELEEALEITSGFKRSMERNEPIFVYKGRMMDLPVVEVYEKIVEKAKAGGMIPQ
ncbi:MAG: CoA ester lyase [Deltaproteobacteria bacterium]|nr:CoA ester lyase [Deltaproteobacteria bacterium]MBW2025444.1 CoA ester lyase [Deltaproteobacteria bacterium]MBW2126899.1 CoA ester lyase [Deltaproteobacteria bacterium]